MDCINAFYVGMIVIVGALLGVLMLMLFTCILLFFISVQILPSLFSSVVTWLIEDRTLVVAALIGSFMCLIWFIPQELKKKKKSETEPNRCKDCESWTRLDDFITEEPTKFGECKNEKFSYKEYPEPDGLMFADAESYSAWFHTGENFGCVHFKKKSPKEIN